MNLLDGLYNEINTCQMCHLKETRNTEVRYSYRGNPKAKIMIVGEAFGKNEVKEGKPFVGKSGKELNKMLKAIGLDIDNDIYVTNIVKDRPTDDNNKDRKPLFFEIDVCKDFLLREIQIVKPKLIVTLGRTASDWFFNYGKYEINTLYFGKHYCHLPLYHPSYLLRKRDEIKPFCLALKGAIKECEL